MIITLNIEFAAEECKLLVLILECWLDANDDPSDDADELMKMRFIYQTLSKSNEIKLSKTGVRYLVRAIDDWMECEAFDGDREQHTIAGQIIVDLIEKAELR
jgi:hypothetical protein